MHSMHRPMPRMPHCTAMAHTRTYVPVMPLVTIPMTAKTRIFEGRYVVGAGVTP